ncbi:acetolactate decarboxylase [Pseudonocardia sp. CA-142604]|uniref:acetolactate decarboxylase n=1 Tax=Pseudonocardia sp. CA-142604 TaxID=3240024 RepID=UPI003D89D55A
MTGRRMTEQLRQLAGSLLAHHLAGQEARHQPEEAHTLYQTSTIAALLDGIYDGEVTIAELLTHGDFGLGTFNHLDGEMVVLDGTCYHLHSDGSAGLAADDERTPFAAITTFDPDITIPITRPTARADVIALIDEAIPSENLVHAVRISGTFTHVRTRTVMAQTPPYPPLTEATADEPITDFDDVTGTLAGFRTPDFEQGISVAGYHQHFLDREHEHGGHALDYTVARGKITISTASELHLSLPRTGPFLSANLTAVDTAAQILKSEGS